MSNVVIRALPRLLATRTCVQPGGSHCRVVKFVSQSFDRPALVARCGSGADDPVPDPLQAFVIGVALVAHVAVRPRRSPPSRYRACWR